MNKKGQKNKGRRLSTAQKRFVSMLIDEAKDITGFTFEQLDEALDLSDGTSSRFSQRKRGMNAAEIQSLENKVAKFLKRLPHTIVVENFKKSIPLNPWEDGIEGRPSDVLNLRRYEVSDFELVYEGNWPTYRRLKCSSLQAAFGPTIHDNVKRQAHDAWPDTLRFYSFQWGVLWDQGLPWLSREAYGVAPNAEVETFLPTLANKWKRARTLFSLVDATATGHKLRAAFENAQRLGKSDSLLDSLWEFMMEEAEVVEYIKLHMNDDDEDVSLKIIDVILNGVTYMDGHAD